jgi:class 3 adenylate cyclase/tetratricopeptide (TPR) repeat protein
MTISGAAVYETARSSSGVRRCLGAPDGRILCGRFVTAVRVEVIAVSRQVQTLLFTDIVGSTDRLRDLGDAAWAALLARHHDVIRAVLAAHRGHEVNTAGDGFLARFDAPAAAVGAAAAAVAAVAPLGIEIRVGLHTGEVELEGNDVAGVGVHVAARVMAEAGAGQVLVSATVRELLAGSGLGFVDLGVRELKGFAERWRLFALDLATVPGGEAEPVAWEPTTEVEGRGGTGVPFPGLLSVGRSTGYVGREELLGRLEEARREAVAGRCRAVLLCGEPGVGKTRTAAEVAQAAFAEGAIVLYGRCDEEIRVPYQPFAEALDWYTTHAAQPVLGRYPGELIRLQPLLGARLAGLAAPVSSDPRSEEYLLFEAARSWLAELGRRQPVVLVLDDLHWASKPVLLLLRHVLRSAVAEGDGVRLLVLGTYRDTELGRNHALAGVMAEVRRLPGVEQFTMGGLSVAEVTEFVSQTAGHDLDEDSRRLAESLHVETEGNPFFVEELLRHLVETGTVRRQDDRWVVADAGTLAVPEGVRDVVGQRLGRLSAQTNQTVSVAAVLGRDFDVELLADLQGASEDSLLDALDEAVWTGLVQETGADRYRFAHVLVRATLYEELSATRRRRLHRRVGETIEKLRPDDVVTLAYHFSQAGPDSEARSRAVRYGVAAAEQALQARALGDAEARFHQVLGLLDEPATLDTPERIAALCGLGEAQRDQGNPEFRTTLLDAGRLAQASGNVPLLVQATLANSRGLPSVIGAVDADRVAITEAALESVGPQPTAQRARLLAHLAAELCFAGDDRRRIALSDEAEGIARGLGDLNLLAWVLNRTGYAAFAPDRVERLVARAEEATRLSDAAGDPAQRVLSRYYWSGALLTAGDIPAFRQVTETMLAVSSDAAPTLQWFAQIAQARLALLDGRFDDAQRINDDALRQAQDLEEADGASWWGTIAIVLALWRGDIAAVVDSIGDFASQYPVHTGWWVGHALSLAMVGRAQEAHDVLTRRSPDPDELINNPFPFMVISGLASASISLDDAQLAARIAATLRPYRGYWAHVYSSVAGPVTFFLALCAAATGDLDESVVLYEDCDQVLIGFGCHGLLPWYRLSYANALRRRGSEHDRRRAMRLLDHVRHGAAAIQAPNLVVHADRIAARIASEANR